MSGQNQLQYWDVGSMHLKFNNSQSVDIYNLPQGPDPNFDYHGQQPDYGLNIWYNLDGSILFFIVDGIVYDFLGYRIAILYDSQGLPDHVQEYLICEVPGKPDNYYIIGRGNWIMLDMCKVSIENNTRNGEVVANGILDIDPNISYPPSKRGISFCSALSLPISINNERYLGIFNIARFNLFKVTQQGIIKLSHFQYLGVAYSDLVSEMEMIITNENTLRIAFPYLKFDCNDPTCPTYGYMIHLMDFDASGNLLNQFETLTAGSVAYTVLNELKGLEFSPDGNILYYTTMNIGNVQTNAYLHLLDLHNGINLPSYQDLYPQNMYNFRQSMIETGYDPQGNYALYFVSQDYIARLGNPNTPNLITWNSQFLALPLLLSTSNYMLSNPPAPNIPYYSQLFLLPDQIDGQNYQNIIAEPTCCTSDAFFHAVDYTVTNSGTWTMSNNPLITTGTYLPGSLKIKGHLTIDHNVDVTFDQLQMEFEINAEIDVLNGNSEQPAARLTIENSHLSNLSCQNEMWQGIRVLGDPGTPHPSVSYVMQGNPVIEHGVLILNHSTIEHAISGVKNTDVNWPVYNYGGIIQATNSTFLNCRNGIGFQQFNYPNASFIKDCGFITNGLLLSNQMPSEGISMWAVRDIDIINCDFENLTPNQYPNINERGKGIVSIDAGYRVDGKQIAIGPNGEKIYDWGQFTNLFQGIDVEDIGQPFRQILIYHQNMEAVQQGILMRNSHYNEIRDNTFLVPEQADNIPYAWGDAYAIKVNGSFGGLIEGNTFDNISSGISNPLNYGVVHVNTGAIGYHTRHNTINDVHLALQTEENNPTLAMDCNHLTANQVGLSINPLSPQGILGAQGNGCFNYQHQPGNDFINFDCVGGARHILTTIDFPYYEDPDNPYPAQATCINYTVTGGVFPGFDNCSNAANNQATDCSYTPIAGGNGGNGNGSHSRAAYLRTAIDAETDSVSKQLLRNELMREYLMLDTSMALILNLQDEMNKPEGKLNKVAWYYYTGDYTTAQNLLDSLPLSTSNDSVFYQCFQLLISAGQSGRFYDSLTATELNQLHTLAQKPVPTAVYPQNILNYTDSSDYHKKNEIWASYKRGYLPDLKEEPDKAVLFQNEPNPFSKSTIIPYYLPDKNEALLMITDMFGRVLHAYNLQPGYHKLIIELKDLPAGLYFYSLNENGTTIQSLKMMLQ